MCGVPELGPVSPDVRRAGRQDERGYRRAADVESGNGI